MKVQQSETCMRVKHVECLSILLRNMGGTAEFIRPLHRFLCKGLFCAKNEAVHSGLQGEARDRDEAKRVCSRSGSEVRMAGVTAHGKKYNNRKEEDYECKFRAD